MSFMEQLGKTLGNEYNYSKTENGGLGFRTTQSALLDMNFKTASYRNASESTIVDDFMKAFFEDQVLAMKWLFFARDVRGGMGERKLFRVVMTYLAKTQKEIVLKVLPLLAEYGRYDDLLVLVKTPVKTNVIELVKNQLESDMKNMEANKPISLLAKWMPSANTSSTETVKLANAFISYLKITPKQYRKMLSKLRSYLKIVEVAMSKKEWNAINYEAVPSKANLLYNGAFLRNDEDRRRSYLDSLVKGEAKINAGTLYPHDIISKYVRCAGWSCSVLPMDVTLEELWKALGTTDLEDTLVVGDGSGSMYQSTIGNTKLYPGYVSIALSIYFAQGLKGTFANKYITFGARPELVNLTGKTLRNNIELALRNQDCSNTNIEAVFELILRTAINGQMTQDQMPKRVLILSDMEFDGARFNANQRLFEVIAKKFEQYGYQLPKLIFWNIASRTNTIPVIENDLGVALVSGFSPSITKMVMSNQTDPFEILVETLNSERYTPIAEALQ